MKAQTYSLCSAQVNLDLLVSAQLFLEVLRLWIFPPTILTSVVNHGCCQVVWTNSWPWGNHRLSGWLSWSSRGSLFTLITPRFVFILVKAGGMRIVQKHPHSADTKEERDKDDQEWESPSPPKPTVFISGVIARGDKDFPPAAAQVAHQKPHASMEKHASPRTQHIQQPRK
ncbi:death-associated protein 1 [Pteropus alecto]|uniref:death-associated protein 1 n=1 Tax=Pteropus alecto TaxID=9402 RepID=UPI000D538E93|nr:death-associated protein 1 [Pteropus alecto]